MDRLIHGVTRLSSKDGVRADHQCTYGFPIIAHDLIGFIAAGDRRDGRELSDDDRVTIQLYVSHAAAVYHVA